MVGYSKKHAYATDHTVTMPKRCDESLVRCTHKHRQHNEKGVKRAIDQRPDWCKWQESVQRQLGRMHGTASRSSRDDKVERDEQHEEDHGDGHGVGSCYRLRDGAPCDADSIGSARRPIACHSGGLMPRCGLSNGLRISPGVSRCAADWTQARYRARGQRASERCAVVHGGTAKPVLGQVAGLDTPAGVHARYAVRERVSRVTQASNPSRRRSGTRPDIITIMRHARRAGTLAPCSTVQDSEARRRADRTARFALRARPDGTRARGARSRPLGVRLENRATRTPPRRRARERCPRGRRQFLFHAGSRVRTRASARPLRKSRAIVPAAWRAPPVRPFSKVRKSGRLRTRGDRGLANSAAGGGRAEEQRP